MSAASSTLRLTSGYLMPMLGAGTYRTAGQQTIDTVRAALSSGYRHVDTAAYYRNELHVGYALHEAFTAGRLKREQVFVTTKLWNHCHRREHVLPALRASLRRLRLDYVDLYLMHWPVAFQYKRDAVFGEEILTPKDAATGRVLLDEQVTLRETWHAMEALVDAGLARSIGVSNFTREHLESIMDVARVPVSVNQVELHVQLPQTELVEFCHSHKIHVQAYCPLGSPYRTRDNQPLADRRVLEIAHNHGVTPAQVLLRWSVQRGICVLPKSAHVSRIRSNAALFSWTLTPPEMRSLASLTPPLVKLNRPGFLPAGFPAIF